MDAASSGCRPAVRFSERPFTAREVRKDAISLLLAFLLNGLVYVCSTALTGWFPNIVAAAWYRAEARPLTMYPAWRGAADLFRRVHAGVRSGRRRRTR